MTDSISKHGKQLAEDVTLILRVLYFYYTSSTLTVAGERQKWFDI